MIKRVLIASVVIFAITGAVVYYYFNKPEPVVDSVFRAVPLDASLLVDIKDYQQFHSGILVDNQLWQDLSVFSPFNEISRKVMFVDSLSRLYPPFRSLFTGKHPLLISGHPSGKDNLDFLYYIRIDNEKEFKEINQLIRGFDGEAMDCSSRRYEGVTIQDVSFPRNQNNNFSYAWTHGLMMLSKSPILLEAAIRQISAQESLLDGKGLSEIVKTAGKTALANVYVNLEHFPEIAQKAIHVKYRKELAFLKNLGNWMELDVSLKSDVVIFNGFSISDAAKPGFEALFRNQKPHKFEIFNKIPASVNTFAILGISKLNQYLKDYEQILDAENLEQAYRANLRNIRDNYNIDLENSFNDIFDQEAAVVFLGGINDTLSNQSYSVIKIRNTSDAEKLLKGFINEYADKKELKTDDLISREKISDNQEIKVYSFPFGNIPASLFGRIFSAGSNHFCALDENYMIFASSRNSLIQYFKYLDQNTTIGVDLDFNNFSEFFSLQSNFFFYNKPSVSLGFYANFLRDEILENIAAKQTNLSKIGALVYQFNCGENHLIYHNLFIRGISGSSKSSDDPLKSSNEIQLDSKAVLKPFVWSNPSAKEPDIFTQDEKNQVYLINKMGRILWKVKLPEPIMSDIFPIDYYKNGKQQLLFNTRTQLYLIDRNGNNVEKFPLTLPRPATNGMAVFDYEKNRDYRIFIAGSDHEIYVFDKKGEPVKQWQAEKTESDVTQPVQHFHIAGKDYLEYNDKSHIYVVDRKGKTLIKPLEPIQISENNEFSLINPRSHKEAKFVITDVNGKVISIGLDGKTKETDLGR